MSAKNDPREPRENRELKFIERVMQESWRSFRAAESHNEKRGAAMILQAHIDEYLDQPEHVHDLAEGVSFESGCPYRLDDGPEGAEMPFDKGGQATDAFFYETGRKITRLYTRAELDAEPEMSRKFGWYVVTLYEKIYATEDETTAHFTRYEAVNRYLQPSSREPRPRKGDYVLWADPLGGYDPKQSEIVAQYRHVNMAIERARKVATDYGIRIIVAKHLGSVDNH